MALDEFSPGRVGHLLAAARFDDLAWDRRVALAMDSARIRPRNRVTVRHLVAMPFGAQMPSRVAGRREGEMFFLFCSAVTSSDKISIQPFPSGCWDFNQTMDCR